MRVNLGIRRRLAPLLHNNRQKIELMHGLLCSLPGTPVLYYGDEIGMGDNVYLGDRDGVRTPMQWSADRNAGFSTANPQKLFLPVIIDPEYNYETVNVEAQLDNPESLLWWVRRLIALRKRHPVFGHGPSSCCRPTTTACSRSCGATEGSWTTGRSSRCSSSRTCRGIRSTSSSTSPSSAACGPSSCSARPRSR